MQFKLRTLFDCIEGNVLNNRDMRCIKQQRRESEVMWHLCSTCHIKQHGPSPACWKSGKKEQWVSLNQPLSIPAHICSRRVWASFSEVSAVPPVGCRTSLAAQPRLKVCKGKTRGPPFIHYIHQDVFFLHRLPLLQEYLKSGRVLPPDSRVFPGYSFSSGRRICLSLFWSVRTMWRTWHCLDTGHHQDQTEAMHKERKKIVIAKNTKT